MSKSMVANKKALFLFNKAIDEGNRFHNTEQKKRARFEKLAITSEVFCSHPWTRFCYS